MKRKRIKDDVVNKVNIIHVCFVWKKWKIPHLLTRLWGPRLRQDRNIWLSVHDETMTFPHFAKIETRPWLLKNASWDWDVKTKTTTLCVTVYVLTLELNCTNALPVW